MIRRREVLKFAVGSAMVAATGIGASAGDARVGLKLAERTGAGLRRDGNGSITSITFPGSERLRDEDYDLLTQLPHLKSLTFYGKCLMTDGQAARIGRIAGLEELTANGTRLTDAGFPHLGRLKNLRKLTLWHLGLHLPQAQRPTGSGFAALAELPRLERFNFAESRVGDAGMEALSQVKQLRELVLDHTQVTDEGLIHLGPKPNLRTIHVASEFSMRIGDRGILALAAHENLEEIKIGETLLRYPASLYRLKELRKLKSLNFDRVAIRDEEMEKLRIDLPRVAIEWTQPARTEMSTIQSYLERRIRDSPPRLF